MTERVSELVYFGKLNEGNLLPQQSNVDWSNGEVFSRAVGLLSLEVMRLNYLQKTAEIDIPRALLPLFPDVVHMVNSLQLSLSNRCKFRVLTTPC